MGYRHVCVPVDNPEAGGTLLRPEPMAADPSGRRGAAHRA